MQFHSSRDSRRIDGAKRRAGDAPRFVLHLAGQLSAGGIDVVAARLARRGDDAALDQEVAKRLTRSAGERWKPGIAETD
jgi:ribose 1,5-bisphosphokinase PhnN